MSNAQNSVIAEPGTGSATIRARVGASAIDKVTRLFSAGLADIFTETLQNSRRGGANRVAATIEQDGDSTRVTLADDGAGIADPAILLTFGESNWKAGIAEAEDPAGFGLLALSRRGCTLALARPRPGPKPRLPPGCWSPFTSLAAMRPMSSRTTAPPGPMEPRSLSRRPRRPTRSARSSRPPRGIIPCRSPSTARLSSAAPSSMARSMWNHGRASSSGSSRTGMRATASPTSTSMA